MISDEETELKIDEVDGVSILTLSGEFTLLDKPGIEFEIDELQAKNKNKYLFDLEKLTFIDSSGLGYLIKLIFQLENTGGKFAFVNLIPGVKNAISKTIKLDNIYFSSREDAIKFLQNT